jgi:hypothetical protein
MKKMDLYILEKYYQVKLHLIPILLKCPLIVFFILSSFYWNYYSLSLITDARPGSVTHLSTYLFAVYIVIAFSISISLINLSHLKPIDCMEL